jgi:hypothetical protein
MQDFKRESMALISVFLLSKCFLTHRKLPVKITYAGRLLLLHTDTSSQTPYI